MALFLHILRSNVPAVKNVSPDRLMAVLVLRWIVQTLHQRALESGMSKEREQERWTFQEARALLAFSRSSPSRNVDNTASHASGTDTSAPSATPLIDRNVQLTAQVLMAIETVHLLSQVLFLTEQVPANIQALSGQKLHAYLTNSTPVPEVALTPDLWDACTASLEDAFALDRQKKAKTKVEQVKPVVKVSNRTTRPGHGLFSLLVDDVA